MNDDAIKLWMGDGRRAIENVANYSTGPMTFKDWLGAIFILALLVNAFWVVISEFRNPKNWWNMRYNDFLDNWTFKPSRYYLYTRRLKKLSQNKTTSEIKDDIDNAWTFREAFIKVYLLRRKKELEVLNTEKLLNENYDHLYEKEMYEDVISLRLSELDIRELIDLINTDSCGFYGSFVYDEYEKRFIDDLSLKSIDKLIYMFYNYKDDVLEKSKVEDIICKVIDKKARNLSNYERMYFKENTPKEIVEKLDIVIY